MTITVTLAKKIDGIGGAVECKEDLHVHTNKLKLEAFTLGKQDNLFLRHLAIYLLDKFFRYCHFYQNRHIPFCLGHQIAADKSVHVVTEFVYGLESSHGYNEHLDWNEVTNAFASFGFAQLDHDLYSGFEGEADSFSHNFFSQNDLFQSELQTVSTTAKLAVQYQRKSTARWMRIDFAPDSFPFNAENFIAAVKRDENKLKQFLSFDDVTFLKEYCNIIQGKSVENIDETIKRIRMAELSVVVATKNEMLKLINKSAYKYVTYQASAAMLAATLGQFSMTQAINKTPSPAPLPGIKK